MNQNTELKLTKFFSQYSALKFKSKEIVYRPDEKIGMVAFVKSGFVRIYNQDSFGKEITYSGFKPVFLMSYLFAKKNISNQYYFQALTDLEIWKAPIEDFEKFLVTNPELTLDLFSLSVGTISEILLSWENSLSGDAYSRIGKLLLILAKDNGKKEGDKITIDFQTTHQLIASMLGVSRETASIQIKNLENNRYITQKKNTLIINDFEKMTSQFQ